MAVSPLMKLIRNQWCVRSSLYKKRKKLFEIKETAAVSVVIRMLLGKKNKRNKIKKRTEDSARNWLGSKSHLQRRVWSWLRMNASGRLNTCKSRGSMVFGPMATGKRVRNAYTTNHILGDSPEKLGIIPHKTVNRHRLAIKDLLVYDGCA